MPHPRKTPLPPLDVEVEAIAARIVKLRKLRGLTQKELAEKIGISRDSLASHESGRVHLNDEIIVRFALALRISTDELLGVKKGDLVVDDPPTVRIVRRMQKIQKLTASDQKAILRTIDAFLDGASQSEAN